MIEVISAHNTPNPLAKKFELNENVTGSTPVSINSAEMAPDNDLAQALFEIDHLVGIFILKNAVTITKAPEGEWETMIPEISILLEEYLEPVTTADSSGEPEIEFPSDFFGMLLSDQIEHIEKVLDQKIRPGLAGDGGGLQLMGIDEKTVYVYYLGACGSCPSAGTATLDFIRRTLKQFAHPEIQVELS